MRAATRAEMTLDLREVTTPGNSGRAGGALATRGWVTSVKLRSVGMGSAGPHAVTSRRAGRNRIMGELRVDRVLGGLHEARVQAARGEEVVVVALLDDAALVHHDD